MNSRKAKKIRRLAKETSQKVEKGLTWFDRFILWLKGESYDYKKLTVKALKKAVANGLDLEDEPKPPKKLLLFKVYRKGKE